jgi:hypothetical protein
MTGSRLRIRPSIWGEGARMGCGSGSIAPLRGTIGLPRTGLEQLAHGENFERLDSARDPPWTVEMRESVEDAVSAGGVGFSAMTPTVTSWGLEA